MSRIVRVPAGIALILAALSGMFVFEFWQNLLFGVSADGQVVPHTWLLLRIMLVSLAAPGAVLIAWPWVLNRLAVLNTQIQSVNARRF